MKPNEYQHRSNTVTQRSLSVNGLTLHYRELLPDEANDLPPVLLLHGFPTSSYLWRNMMSAISKGVRAEDAHAEASAADAATVTTAAGTAGALQRRVIALDLPGYGESSKTLEHSYSFKFYERALNDFLRALEIDRLHLVVHDIGGPIGLYWAIHRPEAVASMTLLNTVVYSDFSWAVILFLASCKLPGLRHLLASPLGLKLSLDIGMAQRDKITPELIRQMQLPFQTAEARQALLKAGAGLHPKGFKDIESGLDKLNMPLRMIYGVKDRILPDIAKTAQRLQARFPQMTVTALPHCGHFLQEDDPEQVGNLLSEFIAGR